MATVVTAFSLPDAKTAVRDVINRLVREERLLGEAAGSDLATRLDAYTDAFALDDMLVRGTKLLQERICGFPLCFNPPRPPKKSDGKNTGGRRPTYCDGLDERGHPHADSQYATRRRDTMRKNRRAAAQTEDTEEARGEGASRPISHARNVLTTVADTLQDRVDQVVEGFQTLQQLVQQASDGELAAQEIEAVRAEAREQIEHEKRLRLAAEARTYETSLDVNRMTADVEEIRQALTEIEQRIAEVTAERDAAAKQAVETAQAAEDEITDMRQRAEAEIMAAQATFDRQLAERSRAMEQQIAAANSARDAALTNAATRESAAAASVAAANEQVTKALADLDEAKKLNTRLAADNTELRDAAIRREREFEEAVAELHERHHQEQDSLRDTINQMQTKADEARNKHDQAMEELRTKLEEELHRRLNEAETTTARIHSAETAQLTAQIELLQTRLKTQERP